MAQINLRCNEYEAAVTFTAIPISKVESLIRYLAGEAMLVMCNGEIAHERVKSCAIFKNGRILTEKEE